MSYSESGERRIGESRYEAVLEMPIGTSSVDVACAIMGIALTGRTNGLPLYADSYEFVFYKKD